ncbi:MAG: cyclic nucleotide-binding domain-containing protein [Myxococcota bacterium]
MKAPIDAVSALKAMPLLADLPHAEVERLASRAKVEHYVIGEELIKEGTSGSMAYFVVSGTCDVRRKRGSQQRRVATLGPGDFFGELSIVDPAPRTATVTAAEDVTVLVLSGYDFNAALKANKSMALHLVKTLAKRLRAQEDEFLGAR